VGDVSTLASFPIIMQRTVWDDLARQAEQLAAEAEAAELEISHRPELLQRLGLPHGLMDILADGATPTPAAGRVIRFDFHFTTDGWKISEANSDVPGGFSEASHFTTMMAEQHPLLQPAGNPGDAWCYALATIAGPNGVVALLSAAGYMEDHQVISFLAARLRARGCRTHLAKPAQIRWHAGRAHLDTAWHRGPLDAIVRFYQAEWLSRLPDATGWKHFFRGGLTPVANPALALISESKRFPLVWDQLSTPLPTWRTLLPESRDPRAAAWSNDDSWLLKTAFCNTGDTVSIRELMRPGEWLKTRLKVFLSPDNWVAQRRFDSVPLETPLGPRHVCVGIYTVNGRSAGAYVRLSKGLVVNYAAMDAALLLEDDE
jgi:glutathionylspermidine synthase